MIDFTMVLEGQVERTQSDGAHVDILCSIYMFFNVIYMASEVREISRNFLSWYNVFQFCCWWPTFQCDIAISQVWQR